MKSTIIFQHQNHDTVRSLSVTESEDSFGGNAPAFKAFRAILEDGTCELEIPKDKLTFLNSATWFMSENPLDFRSDSAQRSVPSPPKKEEGDDALHFQAIKEVAHISTVWKETAKVQVDQRLTTYIQEIACDLDREDVVVDRRTVDRVLEEGESVEARVLADGTVVIPVIQERLVVTKIRVLCEEVVVKKQTGSVPFSSSVELRSMELDVTKTPVP